MKAILTYHSIDGSGSPISVAPAVFERHVRSLAAGSVAVVPLADLLRTPDDVDAVSITFDDGYVNFATEAWPRLAERGLPVTVFVPTSHAGRTNAWMATPGLDMPQLPLLGWDALGRLQEKGVSLGAHSRTHSDLRALAGAALADEVYGSFDDLLKQTGRRPDTFAYPYGHWTPALLPVVRSACSLACTTHMRWLTDGEDPHLLPRLDAYYLNGLGGLDGFARPVFRAYIGARAVVRAVGERVRPLVAR